MRPANADDAKGIDVSNWQGTIDWAKVASDGVTFAYAKATEGTGYTDPQFKQNYFDMKSAGILRGAYHFARPAAGPPEPQADRFIEAVNAAGGFDELPPMLDLEDKGGLNETELTAWVNGFMARVKEKTGRNSVLYLSRYFANTYVSSSVGRYPLFAAEYGVNHPGDFKYWTRWKFWQHTNKGNVNGINGNVDMDWFAGTVDELEKFCGIHQAPAPVRQNPDAAPATTQGGNDVQVPELKQDDKGHKSAVMAIQGAVAHDYHGEHGYGFPVDGKFGVKTDAAVRNFQKRERIRVDGVVGPETWSKILA